MSARNERKGDNHDCTGMHVMNATDSATRCHGTEAERRPAAHKHMVEQAIDNTQTQKTHQSDRRVFLSFPTAPSSSRSRQVDVDHTQAPSTQHKQQAPAKALTMVCIDFRISRSVAKCAEADIIHLSIPVVAPVAEANVCAKPGVRGSTASQAHCIQQQIHREFRQ